MADWVIERFDPTHDRGAFSCGQAPLDHFLRTLVSQYEKRGLGRTYVAIEQGQKRVAGYYTLASGAVVFQTLPPDLAKRMPRHPVPVVLLGRLAVDLTVQGQGLGRILLADALRRSLGVSETLGVYAVEVAAIDEAAKRFYLKYGFVELLDDPLHLLLPLKSIGSRPLKNA